MGRFTLKTLGRGTRRCDGCTACCTVSAVKELKKPGYEDCPHQTERGCGIHSDRPVVCREFQCGWTMGYGKGRDRPDLLGVYLTFMSTSGFGRIARLDMVGDVHFDDDKVIAFVSRANIIDKHIVIGVAEVGAVILGGPSELVDAYRKSLRQRESAGHDTGFVEL